MVNSRCSMKCSHGIGTLWRLKWQKPLSRSGFLIFPVPTSCIGGKLAVNGLRPLHAWTALAQLIQLLKKTLKLPAMIPIWLSFRFQQSQKGPLICS
ncbi:hypothetical protein SDJN03_24069, partial [Cucurbita argyrosperma subsp. sororia]